MENSIKLKECIEWMNAGLHFSFTCCSYDKKRPKKCGKWITSGDAVCIRTDEDENDTEIEVQQEENDPSVKQDEELNKNLKRNPRHRLFFTRNIRLCVGSKPVGTPIKIHLDLLTRFNGKKVILP